MARKTNTELYSEMEEKLSDRSSDEIIRYLGNYFTSSELEDFNEFLEDEKL